MVTINWPSGVIQHLFDVAADQTLLVVEPQQSAGDYNRDGFIDAADYVVWRKGAGTMYSQNDFNVWRAQFGQTIGSGASASANSEVPEPAGGLMLILGMLAMCPYFRPVCRKLAFP
jgi:hypothetical protein